VSDVDQFDGWTIAKLAWGMVVSFVAWLGIRSVNRLDQLERTYVSRDEMKEAFERLQQDRKAMHLDNKESLQRIEAKLDASEHEGIIATRLERVEEDILDLRRWKHESVDPYIPRAVDDLKERVDRWEAKQSRSLARSRD